MELWTFLISMMPVGELRFSIPFGYFVGLHWYESFIYSLLGNALITLHINITCLIFINYLIFKFILKFQL